MKRSINRQTRKKKALTLGITALLAAGLGLLILEAADITNVFSRAEENKSHKEEALVEPPQTAKESFSEGEERSPGNTMREDEGSGIVEDRAGVISERSDPSNWTTSSTGEIIVHNPHSNKIIKSGGEISGTSTLPKVSYRLIDTISGVISQGELMVVEGKFSGRINFSTNSSEGRIDLFGTEADGREFSNVEIGIRYD